MSTISVQNKVNVDIPKLKSEIEASGKYTVLFIREIASEVQVNVIYTNQSGSLDSTDTTEVVGIINNHNTQFRRKVLVQELPDDTAFDDAAVNKKYIDNLVGGAPGYLDTLKELSDAIGAESEGDLAPSILSKIAGLRTDLTITQDDLESTQTSLNSTQTSLTQEISRAQAAEADLQNAIDTQFIPTTLDGLTDVTITTPQSNQFLKYNGLQWVNVQIATVGTSGSYNDLSDTPFIPLSLTDLSDVTIFTATKGHLLVHNGTEFVNSRTIESDAPSMTTLVIKGAVAQSETIFSVQSSSESILSVTPTAVETKYNAITSKETNATATTTDATQTTLYSLTLSDDTAYTFDINVIARCGAVGAAKMLSSKLMFGAHKVSGSNATLANDFGGPIIQLDTSGNPIYDVSVDISGAEIRVRVAGGVDETVKWAANVKLVQVS